MKRQIDGLLRACELLAAEAARLDGEPEFAVGTERKNVDITDLWLEYLARLIAAKQDLVCKLRARQAQLFKEFRSTCIGRAGGKQLGRGTEPPVPE